VPTREMTTERLAEADSHSDFRFIDGRVAVAGIGRELPNLCVEPTGASCDSMDRRQDSRSGRLISRVRPEGWMSPAVPSSARGQ
jgi:hypothetical protein